MRIFVSFRRRNWRQLFFWIEPTVVAAFLLLFRVLQSILRVLEEADLSYFSDSLLEVISVGSCKLDDLVFDQLSQ